MRRQGSGKKRRTEKKRQEMGKREEGGGIHRLKEATSEVKAPPKVGLA